VLRWDFVRAGGSRAAEKSNAVSPGRPGWWNLAGSSNYKRQRDLAPSQCDSRGGQLQWNIVDPAIGPESIREGLRIAERSVACKNRTGRGQHRLVTLRVAPRGLGDFSPQRHEGTKKARQEVREQTARVGWPISVPLLSRILSSLVPSCLFGEKSCHCSRLENVAPRCLFRSSPILAKAHHLAPNHGRQSLRPPQ
jgi:hypothetical protein